MSNYTKSTNFATKDNLTPGDPLKVVRGTEIDTEYNNIATAIATKTDNASAAITGGSITGITDLAVADGGTGASTAAGALNNLLPSQTSAANKYLQSDGTNASWDAVTLSTADITGTLPVANGGTGVTSSTGTGSVVLSNSPTLVTPALGTPSALVGTNITGTASGLTAGTVTTNANLTGGVTSVGNATTVVTNANLTGAVTSVGNATSLGSFTSANLLAALTDETGTGSAVFATSPTLVTPALGTPSALVGTNITGTASGLTAGNVTTNANLTGAVTSVGNATSLGSFSSANLLGALTDETGTGSAVFATSPTLVTPTLGVATATSLQGIIGNVTPAAGSFTTVTASTAIGTASGGTGLGGATPFTANGVVFASSASALSTGANLTFNGNTLTSSNATGANVIFNSTVNTPFVSFAESGASKLLIGASAIVAGGAGYDFYGAAGIGLTFHTNATRRLDITSAGDVGIGTSSPAFKLDILGSSTSGSGIVNTLRLQNSGVLGGDGAKILFTAGTSTDGAGIGSGGVALNSADLRFFTGGNNERARITSGGALCLNESSASTAGNLRIVQYTGSGISRIETVDSGTVTIFQFVKNSGGTSEVGSITSTTSATAYNTSSDYRLKNTVAPMTGALAKVALLKPVTYKWNADGSDGEGFIAHELAEVCPYAVTGEKDAVDADGKIKPQGIDVSFLVATLTAAIQEQQAIIESLKARLDAANL